ncbi:MAG: hypothetical protein QOE57_916 [Acidimicrobiaceae bacterium]|jgi:hypothetical protein|nr:hypothetical protein [Acidimicrobiaceae bacterium]
MTGTGTGTGTGTTATEKMLIDKMDTRFATAGGVADAVLYEGYILYPYHATHGKNRGGVRFQWGVLVPPAWREVDSSERSVMRTELIVDPGTEPMIAVRLRFLQLQHRGLEEADPSAESGYRPTSKLEIGDEVWMEWDEAIEQTFDLGVMALLPLAQASRTVPIDFPASSLIAIVGEDGVEAEVGAAAGPPAGRIVRSTEPITGEVRVTVGWADGPGVLLKVTIEVENTTDWKVKGAGREDVMRRSLIAVHTLAAVEDAAFCSLFDPPEGAEEAVAGCQSIGSYAVLVGKQGATDLVLASPIILYDYPAIAPESDGDFHDGCEIDEILALRVLTLTDDEKAEARGTDPRSRAIIDRCDNMVDASWDKLHGIMRDVRTLDDPGDNRIDPNEPEPVPWLDPVIDASFDPWSDIVVIRDVEISKGSRVRLAPNHRADVHDMFLAGLTATVAGVFHDVDGGFHVAVTVDGDPATELYEVQGRFYYFHPDEIEPLSAAEADAFGQAETMRQAGRDVDAARSAQVGWAGGFDFPTIVGDGTESAKTESGENAAGSGERAVGADGDSAQ